MPLFLVRRPFPGGTEATIEAAGYRSEACIPFYEGMDWLETYWDSEREETLCLYKAASADDIRRHAIQANIPCEDVHMVRALVTEARERLNGTPAKTPVGT